MFSLKFRDALPSVVADELDNLITKISGFLRISFNEDGTLIDVDPSLNGVPIGSLQGWLTGTPPTGWLILDGSQKNRVTYKALYEKWGTTFGVGDGSTTFNLPDMRGRFFLGKAAAGTGSVIGATGGSLDHTHSTPSGTSGATAPGASVSGSTAGATATISGSTANESSHTHPINIDTGLELLDGFPTVSNYAAPGTTQFQHHHNVNGNTGAGSAHNHGVGSLGVDSHAHGVGSLGVTVDSHTHSFPVGTSGSNNPAYFVGNWIVYTGVA